MKTSSQISNKLSSNKKKVLLSIKNFKKIKNNNNYYNYYNYIFFYKKNMDILVNQLKTEKK